VPFAAAHQRPDDPHKEADEGEEGHENEPEPQEAEDLLVEQVDGQCTLECPPLYVVQLPYLKVTQCHLKNNGARFF
jgi:hypothetical protein